MSRAQYFMPDAQRAGLQQLAAIKSTTEAEQVRLAVKAHLKRNKINT